MHHMIDGLVDSETSEDPKPILHLTPLAPGQSFLTPTLGTVDVSRPTPHGKLLEEHSTLSAQDLVKNMLRSQDPSKSLNAPNMEREQTIQATIPNFSEIPFARSLSEMDSPQTRPTTAHKVQFDSSTPVPLSSGSAFQQEIFKRQQQLQMQPALAQSPIPTSSWSYHDSPVWNRLPPIPSSPWTASASSGPPSPCFRGDEVPRKAPQPAMFGAIGQTPPSAQAD